jgi:Secretion system C-terminal sorting domain
MNRKFLNLFLFILGLLILANPGGAQSLSWEFTIPGNSGRISGVEEVNGNEFLAVGTSKKLLKLNSNGDLIWQKSIIDTFPDGGALGIIKTIDENKYFIYGSAVNPGLIDFISLIDSVGNEYWIRLVSRGTIFSLFQNATLLKDGSLVTVGFVTNPFYQEDFIAQRWDTLGNLLWDKQYNIIGNQRATGICSKMDGSLIISGNTGIDNFLLQIDIEGNVLGQHTFLTKGGNSRESHVNLGPGNLIYFSGNSRIGGGGSISNYPGQLAKFNGFSEEFNVSFDFFFMNLAINSDSLLLVEKLDILVPIQGVGLNNETLSNSAFYFSTPSKNIDDLKILGGNTAIGGGFRFNGVDTDFWVFKLDSVGEPWVPNYCDFSQPQAGFSWDLQNTTLTLIDTSYSGVLYHDTVYSRSWEVSNFDTSSQAIFQTVWDTSFFSTIDVQLIVTNFYQCRDTLFSTLSIGPNGISSLIHDEISFNLYPNPLGDKLTIESVSIRRIPWQSHAYGNGKESQFLEGRIDLFDLNGREILHSQIRKEKEELDLSALSPGVYIARIEVNGVVERRKVIKQ